jgi:selenocysteine lyase/cysteine desulfurase
MPSTPHTLYLDNAATSFPKPPAVHEAMAQYATQIGASAGRGAYAPALETGHLLTQCRQRLSRLFNAQNPNHFIFTLLLTPFAPTSTTTASSAHWPGLKTRAFATSPASRSTPQQH